MAVLNQKKSKVSDEIPTASMADIAFLLLIFFLVTTVFPKDKGLSVVLPEQGETVAGESDATSCTSSSGPMGLVDLKRGRARRSSRCSLTTSRPSGAGGGGKPEPHRRREDGSRCSPSVYDRRIWTPSRSAGAERISFQILEEG